MCLVMTGSVPQKLSIFPVIVISPMFCTGPSPTSLYIVGIFIHSHAGGLASWGVCISDGVNSFGYFVHGCLLVDVPMIPHLVVTFFGLRISR
jgi:hypothetical protein